METLIYCVIAILGFVYWFFCFGYTLVGLTLHGIRLSVFRVLVVFILAPLTVPYKLGVDLCSKLYRI